MLNYQRVDSMTAAQISSAQLFTVTGSSTVSRSVTATWRCTAPQPSNLRRSEMSYGMIPQKIDTLGYTWLLLDMLYDILLQSRIGVFYIFSGIAVHWYGPWHVMSWYVMMILMIWIQDDSHYLMRCFVVGFDDVESPLDAWKLKKQDFAARTILPLAWVDANHVCFLSFGFGWK